MRTGKTGLDYFPLDVDFFDDEKIQFVSAKYDILGENVCIKLLMRVYRSGYCIHFGDDEALLFAKKIGVEKNIVDGVVKELLKRGFFSQNHFEKFEILTSNGIQKRFLEATKRRKKVEININYLIADIEGFNVNIIGQNDDISTQRRKKGERKEKEVGGNPLSPPTESIFISIPLNDKTEYPITKTQVAEFKNLYPGIDVEQSLRTIKGWNLANPTNRKTKAGILKHINGWLARDQNQSRQKKTDDPRPPLKDRQATPTKCQNCQIKSSLLETDDSGKYLCPTCRGAKSYSEFTGDPGASIEALIGKAFSGGNGDESDTGIDEQDRVRQLRDQAAVLSGQEGEIDDVPY